MWLGSEFFVFFPEQFTGLFFPGMGLGLLMPIFFVSIKQKVVGPCPAESFVLEVFPLCMEKEISPVVLAAAWGTANMVTVHVHAVNRMG